MVRAGSIPVRDAPTRLHATQCREHGSNTRKGNTMANVNKSQLRRWDAIGQYCNLYPLVNEVPYDPSWVRDQALDILETMEMLGRTARWQNNVKLARNMINEYPNDAKHIAWAIAQSGVYLNYAS